MHICKLTLLYLREVGAVGPDGGVMADDGGGGEGMAAAVDIAHEMLIHVSLPRHLQLISLDSQPRSPPLLISSTSLFLSFVVKWPYEYMMISLLWDNGTVARTSTTQQVPLTLLPVSFIILHTFPPCTPGPTPQTHHHILEVKNDYRNVF